MHKKTLILGVGNTLLSDEGVGVRMLDYLCNQYPDLQHVTCLDGGTLSFTLAAWLETADNLIVVDAAELHEAPGTVQVFEGEAMDRFVATTRRSVHEVSIGDLLAIARLTDTLPENRLLAAVQPQHIDWGSQLSPAVERARPEIARQVVAAIERWKPRVYPRLMPAPTIVRPRAVNG